jgi:hypothetical protein
MTGTTNTVETEPFTVETLREAMRRCPQPIGYALLNGSVHVDKVYKIRNDLEIGIAQDGKPYMYLLVVPSHFLQTAVDSLRATPSQDVPSSYEFPVFSLLKDGIG